MAKSKGPNRQEWHKAFAALSPTDAAQMILVGIQRTRRSIVAPRKWVLSDVYPVIYVMG